MRKVALGAKARIERGAQRARSVFRALGACVEQERKFLKSPAARVGIGVIYVVHDWGTTKTDLTLRGRLRSYGSRIAAAVRGDDKP